MRSRNVTEETASAAAAARQVSFQNREPQGHLLLSPAQRTRLHSRSVHVIISSKACEVLRHGANGQGQEQHSLHLGAGSRLATGERAHYEAIGTSRLTMWGHAAGPFWYQIMSSKMQKG